MRWHGALLASLAIVASGCVAPSDAVVLPGDTTVPGLPWSELALAYGPGHDHTDVRHHANLSTPNFALVGHEPLESLRSGRTPGGHLCGDVNAVADGRSLAVVESRSTDTGFAIADVTDPTAPRWLGEFVMRTNRIYDLAVAPDGRHVLLVTAGLESRAPSAPGGSPEPAVEWRSACSAEPVGLALPGDDVLPRPAHVLLVSIEDPARPVIVDERPLTGLGHSVFSTTVDGRVIVLAASTSGSTFRPAALSHFHFYEIVETSLGPRLERLSTYTQPIPVSRWSDGSDAAHNDGWIAVHPILNVPVAYLVGDDLGLVILDVSDLRNPEPMGTWTDYLPGREGFGGQLHTVHVIDEAWDDRAYVIVSPEWRGHPARHPSGILWVLDVTDPAAPHAVAGWTLPHEVEWSETYIFSQHYVTAVNRTAFVSAFHGGLWALDLSGVGADGFTLLPTIGVYLPDKAPPVEAAYRWAPTLQEAHALEDGTVVIFDSNSGLYALSFDADAPAPAPEPWPIDPVR